MLVVTFVVGSPGAASFHIFLSETTCLEDANSSFALTFFSVTGTDVATLGQI